MTDDELRSLLNSVRTIAVVGWSPKPDRASHSVASLEALGAAISDARDGGEKARLLAMLG